MEPKFKQGDKVRISDTDIEMYDPDTDGEEGIVQDEGELVDPSKAEAPWVDKSQPAYYVYTVLTTEGIEVFPKEDQLEAA